METMNKLVSFVFLLHAPRHFKLWTLKKIALFLTLTHFLNIESHYAMETSLVIKLRF